MIYFKIHPAYKRLIEKKSIKQAIQTTLDIHRRKDKIDVNVIIENNEFMVKLAEKYLGEKKVTDIMSFNADFPNPETGRYLLGEIIICYPQAERQAKNANHPAKVELLYLAVHGTLHLLGFDHATAEEKILMWDQQSRIMNILGYSNFIIQES